MIRSGVRGFTRRADEWFTAVQHGTACSNYRNGGCCRTWHCKSAKPPPSRVRVYIPFFPKRRRADVQYQYSSNRWRFAVIHFLVHYAAQPFSSISFHIRKSWLSFVGLWRSRKRIRAFAYVTPPRKCPFLDVKPL